MLISITLRSYGQTLCGFGQARSTADMPFVVRRFRVLARVGYTLLYDLFVAHHGSDRGWPWVLQWEAHGEPRVATVNSTGCHHPWGG